MKNRFSLRSAAELAHGIQKMSFPELAMLQRWVTKLYRTRLAAEEKKALKSFKVGDLIRIVNKREKREMTIKISKITTRKIIGAEESAPGSLWRISPIATIEKLGRDN